MVSNPDYLLGWFCYLLGASGGFLVWWQMTRPLQLDGLREVLRLLVFVALFTPWYADPGHQAAVQNSGAGTEIVLGDAGKLVQGENPTYLAPALIIMLLEGIFDGPAHALRGLRPILLAAVVGLILLVPLQLARFAWRRRNRHA